MREIKFRAWDTINKKFITKEDNEKVAINFESGFLVKHWSLELLQYTGLKDKNGKEAYYGDIIEHSTTEGGIFRRVISWDEELQCTMIDNMPYYRLHESGYVQPSKLEFIIVGNIYETPTP